MQKYWIFNVFLFFSISLFSQAESQDVSVYDLLYLGNRVNSEKEVLEKYQKSVYKYQTNIRLAQTKINLYNKKIKLYKTIYNKLIIHFYYFSLQYDSKNVFLLSSNSFSSFFKRYNYFFLLIRYLKNISKYIAVNLEYLENTKQMYSNYSKLLDDALQIYQNKSIEFSYLENKFVNSVGFLQQNTNKLRIIMLNDYEKYKFIDKIISKDVSKTEPSQKLNGFEPIFPIENPIVVSSFGVHDHPYLTNVKTFNDGVDIYSKTDTIVKSILQGRVVAVVEVPGFGYSVVLRHNSYYSVYSNLSNVYVHVNQDVMLADKLGALSVESSKYSFPCLNIQIWQNTTKLNPKKFFNF